MAKVKQRDGWHASANPWSALWGEVLRLAIEDARRGKDPGWIGSDDFEAVCALGGVDPEGVQAWLAQELEGVAA